VISEIRDGTIKTGDYEVIIDGTDDNSAYNNSLNKRTASEVTSSGETYLVTPQGRTILKMDNIAKFFAADFNKELLFKVKESISKFERILSFAYDRIPEVKNEMAFLKAITEGIDVSSYVKNEKKRYVLIDKIPLTKEEGVNYITPGNIKLLLDFLKIKEVIR
ncbi:MAG: hypothetical protein ACRC5T_06135, partial [Cetobacterium sp.]